MKILFQLVNNMFNYYDILISQVFNPIKSQRQLHDITWSSRDQLSAVKYNMTCLI